MFSNWCYSNGWNLTYIITTNISCSLGIDCTDWLPLFVSRPIISSSAVNGTFSSKQTCFDGLEMAAASSGSQGCTLFSRFLWQMFYWLLLLLAHNIFYFFSNSLSLSEQPTRQKHNFLCSLYLEYLSTPLAQFFLIWGYYRNGKKLLLLSYFKAFSICTCW